MWDVDLGLRIWVADSATNSRTGQQSVGVATPSAAPLDCCKSDHGGRFCSKYGVTKWLKFVARGALSVSALNSASLLGT